MRQMFMRRSITKTKLLLAILLASSAVVLLAQGGGAQPVRVTRYDTILITEKVATKSSGNVASLAQAFTTNVTQGNSIVVACGVGNGTQPTVTDTLSNTYSAAVFLANGSAFGVGIFYATNTNAGADTVTCTNGGAAASMAIQIWEVSGTIRASSEVLDSTNSSIGTSTAPSSGSITPGSSGQYLFAAFGVGTAAQTITVGNSYTNDSGQQNPTTPSGLYSFAAASRLFWGSDSVNASATITSEPWACVIASFRPVMVPVLAEVIGNRAHDAVDSGNPVLIGLRAAAHGANPTAVAAADRTVWFANRAGVAFVIGGHPNVVGIEYLWTTAQTDDPIVTVAGGLKIVVTKASVYCSNANTVNVAARLGFGASTLPTLPTDGNTAVGIILSAANIAAGSGIVEGDGSGILGVGADGEDLRITTTAATSGACRSVIAYYTIES